MFISSSNDLYPGLLLMIQKQQCIHGKKGGELRAKAGERGI